MDRRGRPASRREAGSGVKPPREVADLWATDVECEEERMRACASVYSGRRARARLAVPDSRILITLQAVSMWDETKDDDISALRVRATTLRQTTTPLT